MRRRFLKFSKVFNSFLEFLTVMVLTFVLSQCFIVKLLTNVLFCFFCFVLFVSVEKQGYWSRESAKTLYNGNYERNVCLKL